MTDKQQIIIDRMNILKEQQENKKNRNCKYYHPNNKCGLKAWCMLNAKKCNVNADYCQLKLRKQLARKSQEYNELALQIRETQEYSDTCAECKDDISTNVRTSYSQIEVETRALAKIISSLKSKTQGCEELKEEYIELKLENKKLYRILADLKEVRKLKDHYRKTLEEIEEYCNSVSAEENLYNSRHFSDGSMVVEVADGVLDIINRAKGLQ